MPESDLSTFVNRRVRGNSEAYWTAEHEIAGTLRAWNSVHTELRSVQNVRGSQSSPQAGRTFDADPLVKQLILAVGQFSVYTRAIGFERRLNSFQQELEDLRECVLSLAARKGPPIEQAVRDVTSHLDVMVGAFRDAFGVAPTRVLVLPGSKRERMISVTLDASEAEVENLSNARRLGARPRFLEAVIDALPSSVLGLIDFEFVFPKG
jgi:hypothetical protein